MEGFHVPSLSHDFEMAFREYGRTLGFGVEPYREGHLLVMGVDVIWGLVT